jgi:hypothetical protein
MAHQAPWRLNRLESSQQQMRDESGGKTAEIYLVPMLSDGAKVLREAVAHDGDNDDQRCLKGWKP